ncbi:MAG: PQQ-dependent sugar dehydrogenase [Bacteroidia bacterium]
MSKGFNFFFYSFLFILIGLLVSCDGLSSSSSSQKNQYAKGEMPLQHGMQLFNQYCASCHNFSENGIGPNLTGVTAEVDKEWLKTFINNPPAVIESGDKRAVKLFEKYKQYMPPFPMIAGEDLEDILGFIHKFSEGEKRNKSNRPGGLINPIAEKIPYADLTLVLEEALVIPPSAEVPPLTRINKMFTAPGERLFIHDLRGKLYEINAQQSVSTYLDLASKVSNFIDYPGKASGFGSWAFHPDFEQNGLFYTTHTEAPNSAKADFPIPDSLKITLQWVVLEWKANKPSDTVFTGTQREVLRVDMMSAAHGLQELSFNPLAKPDTEDYGLLYLGIGDGSAALAGAPYLCDSEAYIWGSVIRINPVERTSSNGQYGIPQSNPFVNNPAAVHEIWARGFRNPHRFCWDESGSGKMFITNIGQHSVEEVNLGKIGADYGWPKREGTFLFDVDANPELVYALPENDSSFTYPVAQFDHDEGSAVSGGYVYHGDKIKALKGKYIFGDIARGAVFYSEVEEMIDGQQAPVYRLNLAFEGKVQDMIEITNNKRVELRIGQDNEGDLYLMCKSNGTIYKIVDCKPSELL